MKKKILIIIPILIIVLIIIYNLLPTKVAILTYHDFVEKDITNNMQITYSMFEEEIKYLAKHNYQSLEPKDIKCFIENKCKLSKKSVLITFDDGWISEKKAIEILEKYNMKATIFYIGSNSNNPNFMSISDLEDIKDNHPNITIASHSFDLHYSDSYNKDYDYINNDFNKMKEIIDTKYYAYPYGLTSDNYEKVLQDNDYDLAFTFGQNNTHKKVSKKDNKYYIPRLNFSSNIPLWKFIIRLKLPY